MLASVQISEEMLFDNRLTLSDLRIYASLIKIADGSNECTVPKKEIARISKINRVERYTKNLRRCGYISFTQEHSGQVNTYKLPLVIPTSAQVIIDRLSTFMEEYLVYSRGVHSPATTKTYRGCLRELIKYLGDISLKEIDVRMIEKFLTHKKLVSPYTSRRHYISLKAIFERAVTWEIIKNNPFRKIKQPKVPEVEVAYFKQHELQRLVSIIDDGDFRDLVLCAFYSGFRRGELLALRWRDIDLNSGIIHVRNSDVFKTKSGRNRTIGICKGLHTILSRRKERTLNEDDWVFVNAKGEPLKGDTITKKFKKFVVKAGLDRRLRWHGLRHSSASLMLAMGVPSFAVQKHLGHSRLQTTEKYSHVPDSLLQQSVGRLPIIDIQNI